MDLLDEKNMLYLLMAKIIEERKTLNEQYDYHRKRLEEIKEIERRAESPSSTDRLIPLTEIAIEQEKTLGKRKSATLPFDIISKKIAYVLKKSGQPLSTKQLYKLLTEEFEITLNYANLSNNILPRMNKDTSVSVEKAYRGFWQYRNTMR